MNKPVVNTIVSGPKYAPSTYQTVVLKSSQDFKAVVESEPNKKYIIKYDFDLGGETVTVPEGCLIEMDGGTISNGIMVGEHTILIYFQDFEDCIKSVTMQGTWKYNNPRDGIMTENIYDENLDETQKQFNARVQAALTEANRRAQAVIPLPDEEDLTTDGGHNIKLKNKAYAPAQFSGLGRNYLRKNIVEIALPFDGFVEDVTLESEGLTSAPAAIYFDSTNGIFVGIDNLLDPKYYGTWLNGSAYNTEGTLADNDEFKNTTDDKYYKYDNGALTLISTPTTKNVLTQEMLSQANTVYNIQYDYDLGSILFNEITIGTSNTTTINDTTYYYETVSLGAGKALHLLDTTNCVLLNGTTALLGSKDVYANEASTVYIASTASGTYNNAYKVDNFITIPANCVLEFEGGSLKNGSVVGQNTPIKAGIDKIFSTDVTLHGTWDIEKIYVEWFDDIHDAFEFGHLTHTTIQLLKKTYNFDTPLRMYSNMSVVGAASQAWGTNDRASTLYYTGETGAAIWMADSAIIRNVYIRDLNIFSSQGREYNTTGIFMDSDCHYIEISNVTVKYFKYGIRESYSWHSLFQNVCAYGCDTGFFFDNRGFTATALISCIAYACNVGYDLLSVTPTYSSIISCGSDQCGVGIEIGNARELNLVGFGIERFVNYGIRVNGGDANVNFIGPSISGPMQDSDNNPVNPNAINIYVEACSSVIFQNVKLSSAWVAPDSYSVKIGDGQEKKVMFINCNISKMHSSCNDATHVNNSTFRILTANFTSNILGGINIGYHREVLLTSTYTGSSAMSLVGSPTFITDTMQAGEMIKVINGTNKNIFVRTTQHTPTSGILPPIASGKSSITLYPQSYIVLQKDNDGNLVDIEENKFQNVGDQWGNNTVANNSLPVYKYGQIFHNTQIELPIIKAGGDVWIDCLGYTPTAKHGNSYPSSLVQNTDIGKPFFTDPSENYLGMPFWYNGQNWIKADGSKESAGRHGTFANKPSSADIYVGYPYFCTNKQTTEGATNGIMIYFKGQDTTDPNNPVDVWVDALGRTVS